MRALVTGGPGFLGRLVARRLVERGDEVVLLDRAGEAPPGARLVTGEVTDPATVAEAVVGADAVVHLASLVSAECEVDPAQWVALKARLKGEIDPATDSLRFYHLGANGRRHVEHVGARPALDLEGPLVL